MIRTLFVSVEADAGWTPDEMEILADSIGDVVPDDVRVLLTDDSVEYWSEDAVEEFIETVGELLED